MDVIERIQLEGSIILCILHCGFCPVRGCMKIVKNRSSVDSSEGNPLHLTSSKCLLMQLQQKEEEIKEGRVLDTASAVLIKA